MGLTMCLEIRKQEYVSKHFKDKNSKLKLKYPKELSKIISYSVNKAISRDTRYEVGCWNKANAIHSWFIEVCGKGIDSSAPIEVSVDQLKDLLSLCKRVLDNPAKASLLLPTRGGLLFGSTEYDEKYFENITHTIEILEPVIKFITDKAAKKDYTYDILYIAYW